MRIKEIIIALLPSDEPPLSTESIKIKVQGENVLRDKLTKLAKLVKSKNHFKLSNQFLAFWSRLSDKEALSATTFKAVERIKSAKNFIVEQKLVPHFVIVILGLGVALCNVIVARGADNLYNLIPADPQSQIAIATSISKYTPIIQNSGTAVAQIVSAPTDPNSGVFSVAAKTTATQLTVSDTTATAIDTTAGPRTKNISYTVQAGDTLTGLAMRFNIKASSVKFANNMTNIDLIKPGDTLKIPPDGWEPTAAQIAAANKTAAKTIAGTTKNSKGIVVNLKAGTKLNGYPYGYCTYYVATRRAVPASWGNAGQWLGSAQRAGYATGSTPVPGAIMVTRESWWGHVAYIESVDGDSFTVSEMNYAGWGVTSRRVVSTHDSVIKGFVY
ncbi:MAG: CHAP domain-containing protein [Candidatus Berkelbacteria bacterium]|nr:CHAP domain-containing protein [Candidatus Berkelbacteria bacterium]